MAGLRRESAHRRVGGRDADQLFVYLHPAEAQNRAEHHHRGGARRAASAHGMDRGARRPLD